jgi:hypothetical protein
VGVDPGESAAMGPSEAKDTWRGLNPDRPPRTLTSEARQTAPTRATHRPRVPHNPRISSAPLRHRTPQIILAPVQAADTDVDRAPSDEYDLGLESFRPGQREAIEHPPERRPPPAHRPHRRRQEPLLPAARAAAPGTTVVLSPLIALMADQVQALDRPAASRPPSSPAPCPAPRSAPASPPSPAASTSSSTPPPSASARPPSATSCASLHVPLARHRRGPLHQRVGPRLSPRVPADRRAPPRARAAA